MNAKQWNDSDSILSKRDAIFSDMTCTLVNVKQIRRGFTLKKEQDDDSRVRNTQFEETNHLRYDITRDMRKNFGVYVFVGDDVIA